ncbi:MAG: hypothetical protein QXI12_12365, partial [Candidatus Methanomethyliaceae archaeon]
MKLPRGDEYLEAVQTPTLAFNDLELKSCIPETDGFGLPKPYSGGFTTTFHLYNSSKHWAVRCFTISIPDLQQRYAAIGQFFKTHQCEFIVPTDCLLQGIRVKGQWFPVIKMQWVTGKPLNIFIDQHISTPNKIANIIPKFVNIVRQQEQLGIAHGDLQHGNILVKDGKLYLIDYDGFFLPELSSLQANQLGHPNYQHPARNSSHYNESIDRFSAIVIYLGLKAISTQPSLWRKYNNSENILFTSNDFINVDTSSLLSDLSNIPSLTPFVEQFRRICKDDYENIPTLDQFLSRPSVSQTSRVFPKVSVPTQATRNQYPILDASRKGSLLEYVGLRVEVVGQITAYHQSKTRYNRPYLFLNFGTYPHQTFTLVLWSEALRRFEQDGIDPLSYVGRWVKVSGVLGSYNGKPTMTIESQAQILTLS